MAASPFARSLEAVRKPLQLAVQSEAARARVRDLEKTVAAAARRAAAGAVPRDVRAALERVAQLFEACAEAGDPESTRDAVERALARLEPFADPQFAEKALARSPEALPGVGPRRAQTFERRGLRSIDDLLFHLPARYDDRRTLVSIDGLRVGHHATFVGRVASSGFAAFRGRGGRYRRILHAVVEDGTGRVNLKWFRGGEALRPLLEKGAVMLVTGDVRRYRFDLELLHPEVERLDARDEAPPALETLRRVVPDYSTPEGLNPRSLRAVVQRAVDHYADLVASHVPERVAKRRGLPEAAEALRAIHRPDADADIEALRARATPAHERLVLEEIFLLEVGMALRRVARAAEPGIAIPISTEEAAELARELPFRLTGAQRRAWGQIRRDLARPHPMSRLLQGDVGSGKTAVAFLAARAAAARGHQTALMAPTELLAEQHARTLQRLAQGARSTPLRIELISASLPRPDAAAARRALAAGAADMVVGTHSLVQKQVRFARLGLAVIDEQHRFGVLQRAALRGKTAGEASPHILVMTATPIPRTLALTAYGDLDVSVIDELPPGRKPVATELRRTGEGPQVVEAIRATLARGEQVYVVYPLLEESEKLDLRAATESYRRIAAAFPDVRVDLVHGRLDAAERGEAMARFERGETRILVSTTVIELGVDVPDATLIVVEHAERFGLAQLHQLRGRVGRGRRPGRCLLVARGSSEESEARLRAMLETTDGFRIAEADLQLRGPGEFMGTRQSGHLPDLRLTDLMRDARLVSAAREAALDIVRRDPRLRRSPELARAVARRWGAGLSISTVG